MRTLTPFLNSAVAAESVSPSRPARAARAVLQIMALLAFIFFMGMTAVPASAATLLKLDTDKQPVQLSGALEYLLDTDGQMTLEQIDRQTASSFKPVETGKRHLLGKGSLWFRFDATVSHAETDWRLTVPLPGVDDASLHFRDPSGAWRTQHSGGLTPVSRWEIPARYPVFSLSPERGQVVRYYVQIRHARVPYSMLPQIVSDAQLINRNQNEHMLLGIYFGLAGLVVALALVNALTHRDAGFGTYALYIFVFALAQASFTGLAALYLWPDMAHSRSATVVLLPTAAASAMWFARTVAMPGRFVPALDRIMRILMVVLPLGGVVDAIFPSQAGYMTMNGLVASSMLLMFAVVGVALAAGDLNTRWVAAGFLPILVATVFPLLRNVGLIASSFLSDYALIVGSAVEIPILFYGLNWRLSQRRGIRARALGLGSTDALTGLYTTTVLSSRLQQSLNTAERYKLPFALLLVELVNHAGIQKTHGRQVADRAIVMVAACLRDAARFADTVARVGENQFALLMEGQIRAEDANDMATKILASGLRPSDQLADGEQLQFHIAVGYASGSAQLAGADPDTCLEALFKGLRDINDGSRKAIRLVRL